MLGILLRQTIRCERNPGTVSPIAFCIGLPILFDINLLITARNSNLLATKEQTFTRIMFVISVLQEISKPSATKSKRFTAILFDVPCAAREIRDLRC